jgi:hypothetical protein
VELEIIRRIEIGSTKDWALEEQFFQVSPVETGMNVESGVRRIKHGTMRLKND